MILREFMVSFDPSSQLHLVKKGLVMVVHNKVIIIERENNL